MIDVVIRGDVVVTPHGVGSYDVAISGEKIVAITSSGAVPIGPGVKLIDAVGKIVIPGGIDPHVHCRWPMPVPNGPTGLTDPPSTVSRAALFGGTTTVIDFARWTHGNSIQGTIEQARSGMERQMPLRLRLPRHGGRRSAA